MVLRRVVVDYDRSGVPGRGVLFERGGHPDHGIRVAWFLQLGYTGETWADLLATRELVRTERPDDVGVSVAYPLPGTDPGFDLRSDVVEERFRYVLYASHWVNVLFGLMRREALAQTGLMSRYPGADYALLGELALIGKFAEVREPLLRRRLHSSASSQNTGNTNWMLKLWTGSGGVATTTSRSR